MKTSKIYLPVLMLSMLIGFTTGCDNYLQPYEESGKYSDEILWNNPTLAEGVLLRGYGLLPTDYLQNEEFGADDGVTNVLDHNMIDIATGGWSARNNPLDSYATAYTAMKHINLFLEHVDSVVWSYNSEKKDSLFRQRLKGEAYALRAYYGSLLLQKTGGKSSSGELLGYPIILKPVMDASDTKLPRNLFSDCVKQIFDDCDIAIQLLPLRWSDEGLTTEEKETKGARFMNRINGITAMLLKARVALTAASESFKESGVTMQQAAEYAAEIINANGFSKMNMKDVQFYMQARNMNDLSYFSGNSEIFWSSSIQSKVNNRELKYFPPSQYGSGIISPSQNLVNAFGDSYGNPISISPVYNSSKPYDNRDPRFYMYVYFNGSYTESAEMLNIKDGEKDAIGKTVNSTRTGYYMRKLLDEGVKLTPGLNVSTPHFYVYARYTEALLIFAEAANEAVGPDGNIGGFTAREIIKKIRNRAGISGNTYLDGLDKDGMKNTIRNERRIELCFEGFRFWDIRRWNDLQGMNESVRGIDLQYMTEFEVEKRQYDAYMIYAPIPYNETLKYDIIQNAGWN